MLPPNIRKKLFAAAAPAALLLTCASLAGAEGSRSQFAILRQEGSGEYVATVSQVCRGNDATISVYLATAYQLQGKQSLVLLGEAHSTWVVSAGANLGALGVQSFGGPSAVGCLHGPIALTLNYGGKLRTLYALLGRGTI